MPITPKYSTSKNENAPAVRQFTDREEYLQAFRNKLQPANRKDLDVLVYYGVGGIGKSTLRKELCKILSDEYPGIINSYLDFELQAFREQETSIYHLRKSLRKDYKIEFPTFDIAYAVYWQKTHPQITIAKDNVTFIEDGTIVSDLLSNAGGIPIIGLLPSIAKAVVRGQRLFKEWWVKRGQKELYDLSSLSAKEILDRLPMYFALDLKDYLKLNSKQAVIFIDTYEALWENSVTEGGFFLRDEWLRELISQLPEALWVIFGREKLRWHELDKEWENYLEQHLLGGLSEKDCAYFLSSCGITDEKIQMAITSSSKGVPHYLDLAADTYLQIEQIHKREPVESDFAKNQQEVLNRFLRYLDKSEIETLKVLSVPRNWDSKIFKMLIDEYKTGFPVSAMDVLCRFSFIDKSGDDGTYVLHDLMRQGLHSHLDKELLKDIHRLLFRYYQDFFLDKTSKEITDEDCFFLNEAFYHGKNSLKPTELQRWYCKVYVPFSDAAKWKTVSILFEELISIIEATTGKRTTEYSISVIYFSSILYNLGQYKRALNLTEGNFADLKYSLKENEIALASLLNNMATIYYYLGDISKSKETYEKVIEIRKRTLGENHRYYADAIDNLAIVHNEMGGLDKAIELHNKAAEIYKNVLGENHNHYADAINNLGSSYLKLKDYDKAIELFSKALKIIYNNTGEDHPRYAAALSHLAKAYNDKGDIDNALIYHQKAYDIRKRLLGDFHPLTADSLSNLGQVYYSLNKFDKAIELQKQAAEIYKDTVGDKHLYFAACIQSLGRCYASLGKSKEALDYFNKAKEIYIQQFGEKDAEVLEIQKMIESLKQKINSSS